MQCQCNVIDILNSLQSKSIFHSQVTLREETKRAETISIDKTNSFDFASSTLCKSGGPKEERKELKYHLGEARSGVLEALGASLHCKSHDSEASRRHERGDGEEAAPIKSADMFRHRAGIQER